VTRSTVSTQLRRLLRRASIVQLASVAVVTVKADTAVNCRLRADARGVVETWTDDAWVVLRAVGAVPAAATLTEVRAVAGRDAVTLLAGRLAGHGQQARVHLAAHIAVESCNTVNIDASSVNPPTISVTLWASIRSVHICIYAV